MSKKNVNWTDEDEKTLKRLEKKKELYEEQKKRDFVAEQLFKTGKILKKCKKDEDIRENGLEVKIEHYQRDKSEEITPFFLRGYVEIKVTMPISLYNSEES